MSRSSAPVLSQRALNRATLARQFLLERVAVAAGRPAEDRVVDTVHRVVGMQAQEPLDPYTGLWSRLEGFTPDDLATPLLDRRLARIVVMRGTIHLVTAEDLLWLRPLIQPILDRELRNHSEHKAALAATSAAKLEAVLAFARDLLAVEPLKTAALRQAIAERFPDLSAPALAYACRNHLALVQVPPRGVWGKTAAVTVTTAEAWIGVAPPAEITTDALDEMVRRYLTAFGPATVADVTAWSGLTGMREVVERMRPELVTFGNERGQELFDIPDGLLPDPETPAPVRFLPTYDNTLLSHADRSRFIEEEARKRQWAAPRVHGAVIHDGRVVATWWVDTPKDRGPVLTIDHLPGMTKRPQSEVEREAHRLLAFLHPGLDGTVRFVPLAP